MGRTTRLVRSAARRRNLARPTIHGWVRLESSGWYIQVSDVVDENAAALVGEDAAWRFTVADWRQRRPAVWCRQARRAWRAEERQLAAQAVALMESATYLRTLRPVTDAAG